VQTRTLVTVVCCAALLSAVTFPVLGQQDEPLPPVKPRVSSPASLADAAAHNDYAAFAALYDEMKRRGESVAAYTALYDFWTWSVSDSGGAVYGAEMHQRLALVYPGFADYIAPYATVDPAGNTTWPASETRAFLLERARAEESRSVEVPAEPVHAAKEVVVPPQESSTEPASETVPERVTPLSPVVPIKPVTRAKPAAAITTSSPIGRVEETSTVAEPAAVPVAETQDKPWTSGILMLLLLAILGGGLFAMFMRRSSNDEPAVAPAEPVREPSGPAEARASESPESDEPQPHSPSSPDHSHPGGDVLGLRR
jgi:hypothetical protein